MLIFNLCSIFLTALLWTVGQFEPDFMVVSPFISGVIILLFSVLSLMIVLVSAKYKGGETSEKQECSECLDLRKAVSLAEDHLEQLKLRQSKEVQKTNNSAVISFLSLLQKEGRFIDFVMDNLDGHSDDEIGAAARVVHQGCKSIVDEYLSVKPIEGKAEGEHIKVSPELDTIRYRVLGKSDQSVTSGVLAHPGWEVQQFRLPQPVGDFHNVISPAEIDVRGV